jgi:hypothetical protein
MNPSTRSSVKIQQTAAEEWRLIDGGESRRLTTEEMNDFVVQNSSLKKELDKAMMEDKEKESMLEELGAELEELRTMKQWEEPNADESQEKNGRGECGGCSRTETSSFNGVANAADQDGGTAVTTRRRDGRQQWTEASLRGRVQCHGQVRPVWKGK